MSNAKKIKDNLESEWEVYYPGAEDEAFKQKSSNLKNNLQSEWEVYNPEPQQEESYMTSLRQAIPRIVSDVGESLSSAAKAAPAYAEKAKTEIPGLIPTAKEHPAHLAGQGIAGLGELGQKIFNTPHKLIEYGSERLHLLPEKWGETARMAEMPASWGESINEVFGQPKYPGEAMARGVARNADVLAPGAKIASMFVPTSNKTIANLILKKHDALEKRAVQGFEDVSQMAKERNVPNVPISNSVDIDKLKRYFPKSEETKELLNAAKQGDYDALRQVQSDLFKEAKESAGSKLNTERKKAKKMFDARKSINKAISEHLELTGNNDLADLLKQSNKDYKTLKDVYYNKNLSSSIKNLVNKEKREIPKNLSTVLKKDSKAMKTFKEFHPGLESKANKYGMQQALKNALYKFSLPAAGALTGYAGYEKFIK